MARPESPPLRSLEEGEADDLEFQGGLTTKQINIRDDPTEDLHRHLKGACDWIEASLQKSVEHGDTKAN